MTKHISSPVSSLINRALTVFKKNTFFRGDSHSYYLRRDGFCAKIQISAARMQQFLQSRTGRQARELVDLCQQGGGWWEVTSQDFSKFTERDGIERNGLKVFIRLLNLFMLPSIKVDILPASRPFRNNRVKYANPIPAQAPATPNRRPPSWTPPKPAPDRTPQPIRTPHINKMPTASSERLQQLVARFS